MFKPLLLAALMAVALPATAQDHSRTERVQFARGASSATLHGNIHGYDTVDYVLGARGGQTLNVRLQPTNASAYFNVTNNAGQELGCEVIITAQAEVESFANEMNQVISEL